jgi:hypothetical protein
MASRYTTLCTVIVIIFVIISVSSSISCSCRALYSYFSHYIIEFFFTFKNIFPFLLLSVHLRYVMWYLWMCCKLSFTHFFVFVLFMSMSLVFAVSSLVHSNYFPSYQSQKLLCWISNQWGSRNIMLFPKGIVTWDFDLFFHVYCFNFLEERWETGKTDERRETMDWSPNSKGQWYQRPASNCVHITSPWPTVPLTRFFCPIPSPQTVSAKFGAGKTMLVTPVLSRICHWS